MLVMSLVWLMTDVKDAFGQHSPTILTRQLPASKIEELKESAWRFQANRDSSQRVALVIDTRQESLTTEIWPHDIRSDDFHAVITDENGTRDDPTSVQLFTGRILSDPNSSTLTQLNTQQTDFIRLALVSDPINNTENIQGFFKRDGIFYRVKSAGQQTSAHDQELLVEELSPETFGDIVRSCGLTHAEESFITEDSNSALGDGLEGPPALAVSVLKIAQIATEADYEMNQAHLASGGANAHILTVLNGVDAIYQVQLGVRFSVTFQHTWTANNDPYSSADPGVLLNEFRTYWNQTYANSQTYDLAHLWTGRDIANNVIGIAFTNAVCSSYKYGLSQNYTQSSYNVPLAAHEIGHNFNALHDANCSTGSWIMCPSLIPNVQSFSPTSITAINNFISAISCLSTEGGSSITGSVTSGATVSIVGGGTCSTSGGAYTCSNIPLSATVTITPSLTGYTFSPPSRTHTNVTQDLSGQNFTGTATFYTITGSVNSGATISKNTGGTCPVTGGAYTCSGIAHNSSLTLTATLSGYTFSPPSRTFTNIVQNHSNQNFTGTLNQYTISGAVTPGSLVSLNGSGSCSVTGGTYLCTGIPHGTTAIVTPSLIGYTFSPPTRTYTNISQNYSNQTFSGTPTIYSITGSISSGTTISMSGGGSCTTSSTTYTCVSIPHGTTITITPSRPGYSFNPAFRYYPNISQSYSQQNFTALANSYSISGSITPGSNLSIVGGGACFVAATTYSCSGIAQGSTVTITPDKVGFSFTPPSRLHTAVTQNFTNQNFLGTIITYSITGNAFNNATISISGGGSCSITGAIYTCSGIVHGSSVTITPSLLGYTFTPSSRQYTGVVQNLTGQDFAALINTYSVSGRVLTGSVLQVSGTATCTTSGDNYSCSGIPHDSALTLTPILNGYTFEPASRSYSNVNQNFLGEDYDEVPIPIPDPPPAITTRYALWSGYLGTINILQLINTTSQSTQVTVTLYNAAGKRKHQLKKHLEQKAQFDIIINELPGFRSESNGLLKLQFEGAGILGSVFYYRPKTSLHATAGDDFSFSYGVPIEKALHGTTLVPFNNNPAAPNNGSLRHWLTIVNLDRNKPRRFDVKRFDASGALLRTSTVDIPPYGRVDLDGGHGESPGGSGYNKIIPTIATAPYKAELITYGIEGHVGVSDYQYAYSVIPTQAGGSEQWVSVSRGGSAENWVELTNNSNQPLVVKIALFEQSGEKSETAPKTIRLSPKAMQHLNITPFLPVGGSGLLRLTSPTAGSLLAHSVFYYYNPLGFLEARLSTKARSAEHGKIYGSWNLFLDMQNWLRLSNTTSSRQEVSVSIYRGLNKKTITYELPPRSTMDLPLHEATVYATKKDRYGLVVVDGNGLNANLFRIKPTSAGTIDFIQASPLRD